MPNFIQKSAPKGLQGVWTAAASPMTCCPRFRFPSNSSLIPKQNQLSCSTNGHPLEMLPNYFLCSSLFQPGPLFYGKNSPNFLSLFWLCPWCLISLAWTFFGGPDSFLNSFLSSFSALPQPIINSSKSFLVLLSWNYARIVSEFYTQKCTW